MKKAIVLAVLLAAGFVSAAAQAQEGSYAPTAQAQEGGYAPSDAGTSVWVSCCYCKVPGGPSSSGVYHEIEVPRTVRTEAAAEKELKGDKCEPPVGGKITSCGEPYWVQQK